MPPSAMEPEGGGGGVISLRARSRRRLLPTATLRFLFLCLVSSTTAASGQTVGRCNVTVDLNEDVSTPLVTSQNRNQPIYCVYKFDLGSDRNDWIISIRFQRLKVGRLVNTSLCSQGFVQIIDGDDSSSVSNGHAPGFFCGEIDRDQTYISETSFVHIVFFAESFTDKTYLTFTSRAEQQFELFARYGPNPILYPDRRGKLVSGTFCDRIFHDCRLGTCYVQSPGYPGIYPRNLRCRYFLHTQSVYINPHLENEVLSIDGQHCADMIVCPMRPVTTNCPGDYLRIHDGWTETSPVIGTFCGTGRFPYAITGTSTRLLVVFVSTLTGPMLNTGFHFSVGPNPKWVGPGATKVNGSCSTIFDSRDELSDHDRRFHSLATWYTPNTNCDFLIRAQPNQIIRLYFKSFRVHRPKHAIAPTRDCSESLSVYDSDRRDEARVVAIFCDTWAAPVQDSKDFVSSGPAMLIQFKSATGSYAGSSLDFWIQFDFYNAYKYGQPVANTACDELFQSSFSTSGLFSSPLNHLIFKRKDSLQCHYTFEANAAPFERVFLTLFSLQFGYNKRACISCLADPVDKIVIRESSDNTTDLVCLCNNTSDLGKHGGLTFVSSGASLELRLHYEGEFVEYNYFHNKMEVFQGTYEFFHGPLCGPSLIPSRSQGELVFPYVEPDYVDVERFVHCIWTIYVTPNKDLFLWFDYLQMSGNCTSDRIEIRLPSAGYSYADEAVLSVCDDQAFQLPIINSTNMAANKILVELRAAPSSDARFKLVFTEVMQGKQSEYYLKLGMEPCPFLCHGSNVCIPQDLVCNGLGNCPKHSTDTSVEFADEALSLCRSSAFSLDWIAIGMGVAGGVVMTLCVMCTFRRCGERNRRVGTPR
uniref:CUB domain-containing protein n=1 Tax=Strigamia maritima TaxID=126957 RepID=T1JBN0_STRMM